MNMLVWFHVILIFKFAWGGVCPNNCNSNGSCDSNSNKCTCYVGYSGADCSIRKLSN